MLRALLVLQLAGCITYTGAVDRENRTSTGYAISAGIDVAFATGLFVGTFFTTQWSRAPMWQRVLASVVGVTVVDAAIGGGIWFVKVIADKRFEESVD